MTKAAEKRPVGRPSKYEARFCDVLIEDAKAGLSLTAFAGGIGVARSTLNEWMAEFPEFSEACKKHGAIRARALEEGLLSSDVGARITARIFALKNAAPDEFKDKRETEHSGRIEYANMSEEEIDARLAKLSAAHGPDDASD
jgi:hypothetical protein